MRQSIIVVASLALVAACGAPIQDRGEDTQPAKQPPTTAAAQQSPAVEPPPAEPPATASEEPASDVGSGQPEGGTVATRTVKVKGAEVRVDITGFRREGRLATLNWSASTLNDGTWYIYTYMSADRKTNDVSGVSLVDPVNAKRYRVARSGGQGGACVCSATDDLYSVGPDESATLSATFPAPPAEVTKVNVEIPLLGTFTDVPLA
ncbi:hypothetical protein ACFLIM_05290 [Nonomuraea sp. M3C6]|uniref:Secreted protein n=1 Tax=Nonomuraea marmarensis TaxID=3351344 RepID=A0ABW7A5H1_9ACTN